MNVAGGTIRGLYAAGSATGGIEGGPHAGYIGGLMKALVFGLVAAEDVAANVAGRTSVAVSRSPPSPAKPPNPYPAVTWLVKYGHRLATGLALVPLVAAVLLGSTGHWISSLVLLGASPLVYLLMKSYTELVTLMSDMLIPKQEE